MSTKKDKDKQDKTQKVRKLAWGLLGLEYVYFNQRWCNDQKMHQDLVVVGDYLRGKDVNPWSRGICFGLSVIYLAYRTPKARSRWPKCQDVMNEFDKALSGAKEAAGTLQAIAQAFVRQQDSPTVMRRSDMNNPMARRRGETNQKRLERYDNTYANRIWPALKKGVEAYRAYEKKDSAIVPEDDDRTNWSSKMGHAKRDHLFANFGLKPSPPHDKQTGVRRNYKIFELRMAASFSALWFRNHLQTSDLDALLSFVGEKNTYSLFSIVIPGWGGMRWRSGRTDRARAFSTQTSASSRSARWVHWERSSRTTSRTHISWKENGTWPTS